MVFNKDKYREMLDSVIRNMNCNVSDTDTDQMTKLLNELGIKDSKSDIYNLILWNDHVNDIMDVIISLYEVCKLSNEDCIRVTMEAHNKGKSVVKRGSLDEMSKLKQGLNDRNLEATVEID